MTKLRFGTLPSVGFLAMRLGSASEAREVLDVMRRQLARFGPSDALRQMLSAYEFEWSETERDMSMQEDVEAVRVALGEP